MEKDRAIQLLQQSLRAFNELPNRKVGEIDTYTLASRIGKYLRENGHEFIRLSDLTKEK